MKEKKNFLVVTGGAGFVGSNLIEILLKRTSYNILSLDNYSSGNIKNHIISNRVTYLRGNTLDIFKQLKLYRKKNKSLFHFGSLHEFSKF